MADHVVIRDIRPYDGDYELDITDRPFSTVEWRWIKKISGYLPGTLRDGMRGADPDVIIAFAVIALVRAGKVDKERALLVADRLSIEPFDGEKIEFIPDEEDDDEIPSEAAMTPPPTDGGETSSTRSDSPSEQSQPRTGRHV